MDSRMLLLSATDTLSEEKVTSRHRNAGKSSLKTMRTPHGEESHNVVIFRINKGVAPEPYPCSGATPISICRQTVFI
jgi:hypothetical protein